MYINMEQFMKDRQEAEQKRLTMLVEQIVKGCDKCSQWDSYYGCDKCERI